MLHIFKIHTIYRDSRRRSPRARHLRFHKEPTHESTSLPTDSVAATCYYQGESILLDGLGTGSQDTQVDPLSFNTWEHSITETTVGEPDTL
jgi:hypothetical protein